MLKSKVSTSPIPENFPRPRPASGTIASQTNIAAKVPRRKLKAKLAGAARWLHIYTSLFGLLMTLFFSITGFTLNHAGWFHDEDRALQHFEGEVDRRWLGADEQPVNELALVEHLRESHHITARVRNVSVDEFQCSIAFAGPGYTADAIMDRETGKYTLDATDLGWVAWLNDLHKGRDTGTAWSIAIDVSAGLLTLISITGLALMIWLRRRWIPGALTLVAGSLALACAYWVSR